MRGLYAAILLHAARSLAGTVTDRPQPDSIRDVVDGSPLHNGARDDTHNDVFWGTQEAQRPDLLDTEETTLARRRGRLRHKRQVQVVTVFSTTTITSVVTTTDGMPTTSTLQTLVTETLTDMDSAFGRTTETLTITAQLGSPTSLVPRMAEPTAALPEGDTFWEVEISGKKAGSTERHHHEGQVLSPAKRQAASTVTSVITIISRSVVTVPPIVLVTQTTRVLASTGLTPSISTTITVSTTLYIGSDGTPTTTPSITPAPAQTASSLTPGEAAGLGVGLLLAVLLLAVAVFYYLDRRKKRKAVCSNCFKGKSTYSNGSSTSTQAAARGTLEHAEYFGVGDSPPASLGRGRSPTMRPVMVHAPQTPSPVISKMPPPYTPSPERLGSQAPIILPKRRRPQVSERKTPDEDQLPNDDTGQEHALRHPQTTSRRPLQEQFRHPSHVSSLLVGVTRLDLDDSSDEDEQQDSLPESTDVQPPSPVASSDVFGSRSSRNSAETVADRERISSVGEDTDTLGELPESGEDWRDRRAAGSWDDAWEYERGEGGDENVVVYSPARMSDASSSPSPGNSAFL